RPRELAVAAPPLGLAACTRLADPHAVERPHDRVRQAVLLVRGAREVLHRELLETVRRPGWWDLELLALVRRPRRRRLEHHRRADEGDLPQCSVPVRG